MASIVDISAWRAKRVASQDEPMGVPPFTLLELCPGCGSERVSTMVWRASEPGAEPIPFPRIEPHFLCRDGRVLFQEITDAPMPPSSWKRVMGRFRD